MDQTVGVAASEKALGKRLQMVRKSKGFTQQALCHKANLSYSTLAKIERGAIKAPSIFTIQSIALALGVGLDELMGLPTVAGAPLNLKHTKSGASFVFFDVNATLVNAAQRGFTELANRSGVLPDVVESLFWHHNDAVCRGQMSLSDFNEVLSERLGEKVDWLEVYLASAEPIKPAVELLIEAAKHYRVGLLSNSMPGILPALLSRAVLPALPYAAVVDSSVVGAIKPEIKIYEAAEAAAAVPADQLLLIDDTRSNLIAAEKRGWHVSWFEGYHANESAERLKRVLEPAAS